MKFENSHFGIQSMLIERKKVRKNKFRKSVKRTPKKFG